MRGFQETADPGGIALSVERDHYFAVLFESAVMMEADIHEHSRLQLDAGFTAALHRSGHGMAASHGPGGRPIRSDSGGLSEDAVFLGLGVVFHPWENLGISIGGRTEWRGGGDRFTGGGIGTTIRF